MWRMLTSDGNNSTWFETALSECSGGNEPVSNLLSQRGGSTSTMASGPRTTIRLTKGYELDLNQGKQRRVGLIDLILCFRTSLSRWNPLFNWRTALSSPTLTFLTDLLITHWGKPFIAALLATPVIDRLLLLDLNPAVSNKIRRIGCLCHSLFPLLLSTEFYSRLTSWVESKGLPNVV